jgi:hypothetical protein
VRDDLGADDVITRTGSPRSSFGAVNTGANVTNGSGKREASVPDPSSVAERRGVRAAEALVTDLSFVEPTLSPVWKF